MTLSDLLSFSPEVAQARAAGLPIVALESTIITHGMPFPQNVETAKRVEAEIRAHGAVPATIAIMGGRILIGMTDAELDRLGQADHVAKLSRADLAACLAMGGTGATTVAATMICAHLAGIKVFATGGIGGVHRGAETTFDISADLMELAATPVTVIAAGALEGVCAIFGAHGMGFEAILRNLALLNVLWDGGGIDIDRRSKSSYRLRDRRRLDHRGDSAR